MSIWQGKLVKLRAFESSDADYNFESWNNSSTLKLREFPKFPASRNITSYFASKDSENGPNAIEFHFIIENMKGEIVGDIGTGECDSRFGTFILGYEIKEKYRRNGYATEAILLVLRYYFYAFRFHKVWTSVYSYNEASSKLLEKIGFDKEGIQKEMVFLNGNYFDKILYGMTYDQFDELYKSIYTIN